MNAVTEAVKLGERDGALTRTGDALVNSGAVCAADMKVAVKVQERMRQSGKHMRIGEIIIRMGLASRDAVDAAVKRSGGAGVSSSEINLPASVAMDFRIMPIALRDGILHVASVLPLSQRDLEEILRLTQASGLDVSGIQVDPRDRREVTEWLGHLTFVDNSLVEQLADQMCEDVHDAPMMQRFVDALFQNALQESASDIHFERSTEQIFSWVSYRVDGELQRRISLTPEAMGAICTRVKMLANLDISETQRPQDGRTSMEFNGRTIDLRVSAVHDDDGETITIRLLDQSRKLDIASMFRKHPYVGERVADLCNVSTKNGGIILVTGPTGQGKSTTLAAMLHAMPRMRLKVMTIEDPVENRIPFVHQTPVNPVIGNTYATLMRSYLRQDPDVMMVGEIRDQETAEEFIKGAETGHLMLSTEHTNDVVSAISRLIQLLPNDMRRIAGFTLASSLRAVINQRLVPALCACAVPLEPEAINDYAHLFEAIELDPTAPAVAGRIMRRAGCDQCGDTGYRGRELIVEAVFFPASHSGARQEMEAVMIGGTSPFALLSCHGVEYYSRERAARELLSNGLLDCETAIAALDLSLRERFSR